MYGTQTDTSIKNHITAFENDVKMYGTQTTGLLANKCDQFENDVKMYGTQTVFVQFAQIVML